MFKTVITSLVASSLILSTAFAQSGTAPGNSTGGNTGNSSAAGSAYRFPQNRMSKQAGIYYNVLWGVDGFGVKTVESGELVRFTYRVLDAEKAKALNDKKKEPFLVDAQAGVKLVVPSLEKVGQLRQSSTPIAGMSYWMAFSNPGRRVKRGDHVSVVIGDLKVDGMVVQ